MDDEHHAADSLLAIRHDFQTGAIPRDAYWRKMQTFHLALQQYSDLVREAGLGRIEIHPDALHIVLTNNLHLRWRPQDIRTVPNILLNHGSYEADEAAALMYLARSCRVVFDIGANIGWYSLHLAQLLQEQGGRIYAFEPVPHTFAELRYNVVLNGYESLIETFNLALGDRAGTVEFYVPAFTGSVAASARPLFPDDANQAVRCQMTTMDEFVREHNITALDLIKCDVEGSELFVLRGGAATIAAHQPILLLEMLRKWAKIFDYHPNDIIVFLRSLGYRAWTLDDRQFQEVFEVDESCRQTNFFFLHESKHKALLAELEGQYALGDARH